MIGRIYLPKSSEAERCILPNDAHRKPPARADCAKTAPKSSSTQSEHLADQQKYHSYVSVLLRKGAFKVFRFQSAPSQASFSVCPCPKRSFTPARIQKHPFKLVCTQSVSRVRPNPKRAFAIACIQGTPLLWSSPKRPFALACIQIALLSLPAPKAPSCPPESKTALRGCLNPRLPFTITCTQSPSCHPGSKDPPRVRPSLKHPSCSPKS